MTTATKTHRALAVLDLPRNVPALITYAAGIVEGMTGNAYFTTPSPALATVQTAVTDLQTAETAAQTRAKGAVAQRNAKQQALVTLLEQLRTYVQATADASPESGPAIIQSARLALRKTPDRKALGFHAKAAAVSGSVKIMAPAAARRASYEWQYSTDGGKTWVTMPSTLQAKTSLSGLTPQTTIQLRYRAVVKAGEGDWSQAISYVVV
jgi:hypothetical protein